MAKRRKMTKNRGRRTRRRTSTYRRRARKIKQPQQYFTRTVYLPGYFSLIAGGAAVGSSINFTLSQVPSFGEFTALYDQYKIKAVKCTLIPRHTEVALSGTITQGNMWSVFDYDDSIIPTSLDTLLQYQNTKRTRMNQTHSRYLKPMVRMLASGATGAPKRNQWIDVADSSLEHYGIKFWFDSRGTAPVTYDVQIKYYLAFKNVR